MLISCDSTDGTQFSISMRRRVARHTEALDGPEIRMQVGNILRFEEDKYRELSRKKCHINNLQVW